MAKFAKVEGGKVTQIQPYIETGFIACGDEVICGFDHDGTNFIAPTATPPTVAKIKAEASRRIIRSGHDWMAARAVGAGIAIPTHIKIYAADVRTSSANLEAAPVANYKDNTHWPADP